MRGPNPVDFELPYDQGLVLQVRQEWIAEQKMDGVRALLEFGAMRLPRATVTPPGALPDDWVFNVFDGCLVDGIYYIFDLLTLNGQDTSSLPLHHRRTLLQSLELPSWCRSVPCGKDIGEFLEAVVRDGGSGIILKNLLDPYGNSEWIKVECPTVKAKTPASKS